MRACSSSTSSRKRRTIRSRPLLGRFVRELTDNLTPRRVHLGTVIERRIKGASSRWRQIKDIPNRIQLVDAALFDVVGQPWMTTVKMAQRAVGISGENRNRRVLMSFAIFAAEIVLESAVACAQQT